MTKIHEQIADSIIADIVGGEIASSRKDAKSHDAKERENLSAQKGEAQETARNDAEGDDSSGKRIRQDRFLRRSTALSEKLSGRREEKTFLLVDPEECRMWSRHNRAYSLLNEENCGDLIESIKLQGRQEFPAIVRAIENAGKDEAKYEVICGARRHFAVSWLRKNGRPDIRYLIDIRDLTDEQAFRISDLENRDRKDLSDYERARDYRNALDLYYDGRQIAMAESLGVTRTWLSRYLAMADFPEDIPMAFGSLADFRINHSRILHNHLHDDRKREKLIACAREIRSEQEALREAGRSPIPPLRVLSRLRRAVEDSTSDTKSVYVDKETGVRMIARKTSRRITLQIDADASKDAIRRIIEEYLGANA